jgi:uncharacterized short protein YbdD (DUF466 family)
MERKERFHYLRDQQVNHPDRIVAYEQFHERLEFWH